MQLARDFSQLIYYYLLFITIYLFTIHKCLLHLGHPLGAMLAFVRQQISATAHAALMQDFKKYLTCVGLLETGYFRKRNIFSHVALMNKEVQSQTLLRIYPLHFSSSRGQ